MRVHKKLAGIFFLSTVLIGCAPAMHAEPEAVHDPFESVNRDIFWFNEKFDMNLLGPVAHGYDYVTPDVVQTGVTNFFKNLKFPTYFLSDILQAKFEQALEHTGRFLVNTTVGVLGLVDVASTLGLSNKEEDFGLAFASYGVSSGPYLVLPFLGPSNVRDTVGLVFDTVTNPLYLFGLTNASTDAKNAVEYGGTALKTVQLRENLDDAIKAGREGSIDYYSFMQSSYYQYREGLMGKTAEEKKAAGDVNIDEELDAITKEEGKAAHPLQQGMQ